MEETFEFKMNDDRKYNAKVSYDSSNPLELSFVFLQGATTTKWNIGRDLFIQAMVEKKPQGLHDIVVEVFNDKWVGIRFMGKATVVFGKDLLDFVGKTTELVAVGSEAIDWDIAQIDGWF